LTEAGLPGSNTLPKRERLKHGSQFRHAYEHGRKFIGRLFVLYVVDDPPQRPMATGPAVRAVGVVTSRKVGNAVTRNRARRLLREAYRLNKQKLKNNLQMVMVARSAMNGRRLQDVEAELLRMFRVAGILNET
jgi:ribonuclease P protein component